MDQAAPGANGSAAWRQQAESGEEGTWGARERARMGRGESKHIPVSSKSSSLIARADLGARLAYVAAEAGGMLAKWRLRPGASSPAVVKVRRREAGLLESPVAE